MGTQSTRAAFRSDDCHLALGTPGPCPISAQETYKNAEKIFRQEDPRIKAVENAL